MSSVLYNCAMLTWNILSSSYYWTMLWINSRSYTNLLIMGHILHYFRKIGHFDQPFVNVHSYEEGKGIWKKSQLNFILSSVHYTACTCVACTVYMNCCVTRPLFSFILVWGKGLKQFSGSIHLSTLQSVTPLTLSAHKLIVLCA